MSSTKSVPKRFRIERLEERIAPGFLFWADDLVHRMLAQWAVFEGSDSRQQNTCTVARTTTIERAPAHERSRPDNSERESVKFPVWAEVLLQEIDRERDRNSKADSMQNGSADRFTGFTKIMQAASQPKAVNETFPVWAQTLLTDLDRGADKEAVGQCTSEHDSNQTTSSDDDLSVACRQERESGGFPAWAKEFLSEVDRRLSRESGNEASTGSDEEQSARPDEIIGRLHPSARVCSDD
jgi:hypothetical protein